MKASMTLKPLVFAIAAAMAVGVAQASNNDGRGYDRHHDRHHHQKYDPKFDRDAGDANAYAGRDQYIGNANVSNEGTENTVDVDDTLNDSNGNMGANVAAGSMNQQANNVAIATADEDFVFGVATANSTIEQESDAWVGNIGGSNTATVHDTGNDASGNIGLNAASGNANQQQNALAIATSSGYEANANATGSQNLSGGVENKSGSATYVTSIDVTDDRSHRSAAWGSSYRHDSAQESTTRHEDSYSNSESSYKGQSSSYKNASLEFDANVHGYRNSKSSSSEFTKEEKEFEVEARFEPSHHGFEAELDIEKSTKSVSDSQSSDEGAAGLHLDAELKVSKSENWNKAFESKEKDSSASNYSHSSESSETHKEKSRYGEVENSSLAASVTITKSYAFYNPLQNSATLSGSLNDVSGNIGVNVASGSSNQQLNTLAVAVGCNSCNNGN